MWLLLLVAVAALDDDADEEVALLWGANAVAQLDWWIWMCAAIVICSVSSGPC
jgi:hypothetical protein